MSLRTIRVDPRWILERVGNHARLACDIALILDADDRRAYELLITLNGEQFYERLFDEKKDMERESAGVLRDLLNAGCAPSSLTIQTFGCTTRRRIRRG
jgi:hypothetical protein